MPSTFLVTLDSDVADKLNKCIQQVKHSRAKRAAASEADLRTALTQGDTGAANAHIAILQNINRPVYAAAVLRVLINHAIKEISPTKIDELLTKDPVRKGRQHGGNGK